MEIVGWVGIVGGEGVGFGSQGLSLGLLPRVSLRGLLCGLFGCYYISLLTGCTGAGWAVVYDGDQESSTYP